MQELINELERVRLMTNMNFVIRMATDLLEKEKEQIINAAKSCNYIGGATDIEAEKYYNQTYNQKQHIIDIMKADEDDGLYKMFDTDSDKKH